jgi:GntR family transcriptional repressor for pyruvate dehydrogenase complex
VNAFEPRQLGRKDASGQIARQLRNAISQGVWQPGERLPTEQELADTFDVARATAREGLKLLSATGIVSSARGSNGGTFVAVPDAIRRPVEASRDFEMDIADWLDLDLEFHTAVTKAAKNKILELAMTSVHLTRPATNSVFVEYLDREAVTNQHEAIYRAIAAGDSDAARAAFQAHVSYLDQTRREALDETDAADVLVATLPEVRHSAADRPRI